MNGYLMIVKLKAHQVNIIMIMLTKLITQRSQQDCLGYFCSFHPSTDGDLAYLMMYSITKEELKWANSQADTVDLLPQEQFWFCLSCWLSSLKLFVCNPLTS